MLMENTLRIFLCRWKILWGYFYDDGRKLWGYFESNWKNFGGRILITTSYFESNWCWQNNFDVRILILIGIDVFSIKKEEELWSQPQDPVDAYLLLRNQPIKLTFHILLQRKFSYKDLWKIFLYYLTKVSEKNHILLQTRRFSNKTLWKIFFYILLQRSLKKNYILLQIRFSYKILWKIFFLIMKILFLGAASIVLTWHRCK